MKLRCFPDKEGFRRCAQRGNVIPVCLEILADTETPVSALLKIHRSKPDGPMFLLESVEGGERWGRFSFLGASARLEVRVFRRCLEVKTDGMAERREHRGDPLGQLRAILSRYAPVSLPDLPRFWGGMVGYFAYEMVSFFENIPHELPEEEPLAHFLVTDHLLIFDNVRQTLTLVAHVFLEEEGGLDKAYEDAVRRLDSIYRLLQKPCPVALEKPATCGPFRLTPSVAEDKYRSNVAWIKKQIHCGEAIQVVYSQPFHCTPAPDPCLLYRAQRFVNPSPYMFFLQLGGMALVGSSPETMVRLENAVAILRPIAGTRPRGATEQEDRLLADELLSDPKERAEHLMLVDLGRNDLGRVAEVGTVQVTNLMFVERYSHVMHLVSNIQCDLRSDCDAWDLLRATFPAGTLSGAPKVRAMEIIAQLEEEPRGPYGGAVGYVSFSGNMDLAITIRTACIRDGGLTVRAGGGIVADSDPEMERLETINKAGAIMRALDLIHQSAE